VVNDSSRVLLHERVGAIGGVCARDETNPD